MTNRSFASALRLNTKRIRSILSVPDRFARGKAVRLFYTIVLTVMTLAGLIAHFCHHPLYVRGVMTPVNEILLRSALCVAALVATIVMSRLDKELWFAYGLRARHPLAHFGFGMLTGSFALSTLIAALVLTGGASVTHTQSASGTLSASGVLWAIAFILVGWSEELVFRGYVFFRLARDIGPVAAAVRTSLVFGIAHAFNHGESVLGILQAVLFGLVACFVIWRTGSLWWAAGMHAAWDWSASFLFGAADSGRIVSSHWLTSAATGSVWLSGGPTGPEGSPLALPAVVMLALIVMLAFPKNSDGIRFDTKPTT